MSPERGNTGVKNPLVGPQQQLKKQELDKRQEDEGSESPWDQTFQDIVPEQPEGPRPNLEKTILETKSLRGAPSTQ